MLRGYDEAMHSRVFFAVCVCALNISFVASGALRATEDEPPPKTWTIRIDGYGGTPGDRSNIQLALSHDGQLIVKYSRYKNPLKTVFKGAVTAEDAEEFYRAMTKVIKDYQAAKRSGGWDDGWRLTLRGPTGAVTFTNQGYIKDLAPGSEEMAKVLRNYLKKRELEGLLDP